mgnify:CR=1 FL=1
MGCCTSTNSFHENKKEDIGMKLELQRLINIEYGGKLNIENVENINFKEKGNFIYDSNL